MSKRDRRDMDGRDRDRRDYDRRDSQPDDDQQRRMGEGDMQESDSLTALKAILSKVAALLRPLNLSADEAIRLVEQLYGSVLDMDVALAGEADDTRKSSTLAYIQSTTIRRDGDKLLVEYPTPEELRTAMSGPAEAAPGAAEAPAPSQPRTPGAETTARATAGTPTSRGGRPRPPAPVREPAAAAPDVETPAPAADA